MPRRLLCMLGGLVLVACCGRPCEQAPSTAYHERRGPVYIVIYEWTGYSPGAGFTYTSLWGREVELGRQFERSFVEVARQPKSMIDAPGETIPEPMIEEAWRPMDADEAKRLLALVDAWLATGPPSTCDFHAPGGREDGYLMRFRLRTVDAEYSVRANPPRSRAAEKQCLPDATLWRLVSALKPQLLPP